MKRTFFYSRDYKSRTEGGAIVFTCLLWSREGYLTFNFELVVGIFKILNVLSPEGTAKAEPKVVQLFLLCFVIQGRAFDTFNFNW